MRRKGALRPGFALLILLLPHVLVSQVRPSPPSKARATLDRWSGRLERIDAMLVTGKAAKKAYSQASALLLEMNEAFISGPSVGRFLGVASVLRAIAAHQLGRTEEAVWHWQVANQLFPETTEFSLSAYAEAGPFLKSNGLPPKTDPETRPKSTDRGILPPRPTKKRPKPGIPRAKRGSDRVQIRIETVINKVGRLREPRILESAGELTLVWAMLDELRHWQYKPATLNGEPIAVYFTLTVNFKP